MVLPTHPITQDESQGREESYRQIYPRAAGGNGEGGKGLFPYTYRTEDYEETILGKEHQRPGENSFSDVLTHD